MKYKANFVSSRPILIAIIIAIVVPLFYSNLAGLDPGKTVEQYLVNKWEMADGFPSNEITSITQTHDGYLWFATSKGLVRFDGIKFSLVHFSEKKKISPRETITPTTLFVDREGSLWIGSAVSLTLHNRQTGRFKTFTGSDGLTADSIRCIKDDIRGDLWISFSSSYVNRYSEGKFSTFSPSDGLVGKKINAIIEDCKGNLLFGSRAEGIFYYEDGKFHKRHIPGLNNLQLSTAHEDRDCNLWIGTNNGLFKVIESRAAEYITAGGVSDYITAILEDSERNLWVGTLGNGLNRIKKNGKIEVENTLQTLKILSLFEDSEKNLWVGSLSSGLRRLKDSKFKPYTPLKTYGNEILLSVFEDRQGDTWVGTFSGKLFHCRGNRFIESIAWPEFAGTGISAITEDEQGNLWLGTNGKGLFRKENNRFVQFTVKEGLADNQVTSIFKDSRGNLWLGTFDGVSVYRYPGGTIETLTMRDGLSGKKVHNVYEDRAHNILIAADRGITILPKVLGIAGNSLKKSSGLPAAILPGVSVTCIYEDPAVPEGEGPVYWIATHGAGLKRLNMKNGIVTTYTSAHGFTTDVLYQFFEDKQGYFWFMSNNGILLVSKSELNNSAAGKPEHIRCISYDTADGMKSSEFNNEFSRQSALQAQNGELWFVTKKGISIVNPADIRIDKNPPPVVIETLSFDRQPTAVRQGPQQYTSRGSRDVCIRFTAPTFLSPQKIKFKFRLEGFDDEWTFLSPGEERMAYYYDLPTGGYIFRVTACNADGVWNQTGASVTFTLKSFFFETLFFKIIVFILFAGIAAVLFYIYKKRPFDKKREKKGDKDYLPPGFVRECTGRIKHAIEKEKVYLDPEMTLRIFAAKINIPYYKLSLIINEEMKCSFTDYINSFRIKEAKDILANSGGKLKRITDIAFEVGFNSHSAFHKAFKKATGYSPKQHRKECIKK